MADSAKWYRLLLKLYPARFREEFGGDFGCRQRKAHALANQIAVEFVHFGPNRILASKT